MNRQTHNLQQGSPEWHTFRAKHFGASELPAATGNSKYTSRGDLLREKATGITKEIDSRTQALFDKGHASESSARSIAEMIICDELSPMVMSLEIDGVPLSASLDGITFDGSIIWEHKLWNEKLADQVFNNDLDQHYCMQIEQQLLVSGASKCLFMTSDGTADNCSYMWYESSKCDFEEIVNSWKQFQLDLENYKPSEVKETPKAEAIIALPSVYVQATGMVTASNLAEFKEAATTFIANIKTELVSDQDFADAESTVKFCKDAEVNLEATKASVLAQMSSVDEVVRTLDHIAAQLRDKRLMLDKLVKSEKESRKLAIINEAAAKFIAHVQMLEEEIRPLRLSGAQVKNSFADAIKGKKSLASMQDAVDTALANIKIALDTEAADIRKKLAWCKESSAGFGFLFSDMSSLIANNGMEAFQAIVNGRVTQHKAAEAEKAAAAIAKIEAEAKEKAEREAAAKLAEETERIRAEERGKAQADAVALANREQLAAQERAKITEKQSADSEAKIERDVAAGAGVARLDSDTPQAGKGMELSGIAADGKEGLVRVTSVNEIMNTHQSETVTHDGVRPALVQTEPAAPASRPSRHELLFVIGDEFDVSKQTALEWVIAEFAGDIQFEGRKAA